MLKREQLTRAVKPNLYFVKNDRNMMVITNLNHFFQVSFTWYNGSSFSLYRLNNDGTGRIHTRARIFQCISQEPGAFQFAAVCFFTKWTAVTVAVWEKADLSAMGLQLHPVVIVTGYAQGCCGHSMESTLE